MMITSRTLHRLCVSAVLLLLAVASSLRAAPYSLFTTAQGLSSQLVTGMYQDRYGMIWIATEDGLNRYDGVKVSVYRHDDNQPTSLASDYVKQVKEDAEGNLVVNTYAGLQLYRRATDDFSPLAHLTTGEPLNQNVTLLAADPQGGLIATGVQPCLLHVTDRGQALQLEPLSWQLPFNKSGSIVQDPDGTLWIQSTNTLIQCRLTDGTTVRSLPLPDNSNGRLDKLLDGNDHLYFATHGDLYRIDDSGLSQLNAPGHLISSSLHAVVRYDSTRLLLGTDGDGLLMLDERTGTTTPYLINLNEGGSSNLKVHYMMRDDQDNLWVGLYQQGVAYVNLGQQMFGSYGQRLTGYSQLNSAATLSFCPGADGSTWVGTDGDGLYRYDSSTSAWVHYPEGQVPPIVNAVCADSHGSVWLGSYGYPCYRLRSGQSRFEPVRYLFGAQGHSPRVFAIAEDSLSHLWLATMGNGLYCYDLNQERSIELCYGNMNPWINCVLVTSDHRLLVGTYNGVYAFDVRQPQQTPTHHCHQQIVYCLSEDDSHYLWAGTSRGLLQFTLDSDSLSRYSTSQGLPSNAVYAIRSYGEQLWLSTGAGLVCLDSLQTPGYAFPEVPCRVFGIEDGLLSNSFSKGAVLLTADSLLWFGNSQGITWFDPRQLTRQRPTFHPRITALYLGNQPVTAYTRTGGQPVTLTAVCESEYFSFDHDANTFSVELSTRELDAPALITFCYAIDDAPWSSLPHGQHLVNFSELSPGRHTFRFAARVGEDLSPVRQVIFEVRHPWWTTPWAIGFYVIVLIGLFAFTLHWWQSQFKLRFLSLIAHKVRTPLTLIVNPLQQLISEETDPERLKTYHLMLRNAERMRQMAQQVTDQVPLGAIEVAAEMDDEADVVPETPVEASNAEPSRTSASLHEQLDLLIVDDDDEMRQYLSEQFGRDCRVRTATNGQEALTLVFERQPDAIVSDVTMPVMDGIALCRRLKRNIQLSHIPVLLLTARADEESTLQGLGLGADAYITKPFSIQILRQTVRNIIELRRQLRNLYQGQQLQEERLESLDMVPDYDNQLMERIMQVVNRELSNPDLNADMLCEEAGVSRTQLYRKLKEKTNQSVSIFIRNVRLKQSEQLLRQPSLRIGEVAQQVGFKDLSYFVRQFKEVYGVSPTQWRERNCQS